MVSYNAYRMDNFDPDKLPEPLVIGPICMINITAMTENLYPHFNDSNRVLGPFKDDHTCYKAVKGMNPAEDHNLPTLLLVTVSNPEELQVQAELPLVFLEFNWKQLDWVMTPFPRHSFIGLHHFFQQKEKEKGNQMPTAVRDLMKENMPDHTKPFFGKPGIA